MRMYECRVYVEHAYVPDDIYADSEEGAEAQAEDMWYSGVTDWRQPTGAELSRVVCADIGEAKEGGDD